MSFSDWMKEPDLICHWNNGVPPTTCGHLLLGTRSTAAILRWSSSTMNWAPWKTLQVHSQDFALVPSGSGPTIESVRSDRLRSAMTNAPIT